MTSAGAMTGLVPRMMAVLLVAYYAQGSTTRQDQPPSSPTTPIPASLPQGPSDASTQRSSTVGSTTATERTITFPRPPGTHSTSTLADSGLRTTTRSSISLTPSPEVSSYPTTDRPTSSTPVESYDLRLSGGNASVGALMARMAGSDWGYVCQDGWSVVEATVACAQLGYLWGKVVTNTFVARDPQTMLSGVGCLGGEANIAACPRGLWMEKPCELQVALECRNTSATFRNGSSLHYGQVHMAREGRLMPVCNTGWNDPDARVACREMGYTGGVAFPNLILHNGRTIPPTYETVNYVSCQGDEPSLAACVHRVLDHGCSGYGVGTYATAVCYSSSEDGDTMNHIQTQLVGPSTYWGRVEVTYKGVRATICNKYVDDEEATLVCRQQGFKGGNITGNGNLPVDEEAPILLTSPNCVGNETSLNQCMSFNSYMSYRVTCSHVSDFYVLCHNESVHWHLSGLNSTTLGRLELYYEGEWGSVCAKGVGEDEAHMACTSLGFNGGSVYRTPDTRLEPATGPVGLRNIHCFGQESDLIECSTGGWATPGTDDDDDCADHASDLVLSCYNRVRIMDGGSPNFGRVEVKLPSRDWWGTVCGQDWDDIDAEVVCRELGWEHGKALCCSVLGPNPGWYGASMTSVSCAGDEVTLLDCPAPSTYCRSSSVNYGSVYCYNGELREATTNVYLEPAAVPAAYAGAVGNVRILYQGMDGQVCGDGWDTHEANVTCRELGFGGGVAFNSVSGGVGGPFVMEQVRCEGWEANLTACDHEAWVSDGCSSGAAVLCYNRTGVRLAVDGGGTTGNLIVEYDGVRGHICDEMWTETDANLACQDMGYLGGNVGHRQESSTTMAVFLRNVACTGRDLSLFQCASDGWAQDLGGGCKARESVASVVCYGHVRLDLIASTLNAEIGRVKVYSGDRWAGVCGTGFTEDHARIVCNELGYSHSRAPSPYHFPSSHASYTIVGMNCTGRENSLAECAYNPALYYYYSGCYYSNRNHATVICSKVAIDDTRTIEWVHDQGDQFSGKVQVTQYYLPGKVCADAWSDSAAGALCRNHGYMGGVALTYRIHTASVDWIMSLTCGGNETSLTECTLNQNITVPCSSTREIGALCYHQGVAYRLLDGEKILEGRVEISLDGAWGGVCDSGWSDNDADVICRQLGYLGGDAVTRSTFGDAAMQWMKRVDCSGSEDTLLQCPSSGWNSVAASDYTCGPGTSAGVQCFQNVRISTRTSAGPLQAYSDGYWGSVCDDEWDDLDAQVACRQMGYPYGIGPCCSLFGDTAYLTFVLGGFQCEGTEADLLECPHREGSYLNCPGRNYASVICYAEEPSPNISEARILEGSNSNSLSFKTGVVQVMFAGVWGYICPEGWTDTEASVLCRQLGYSQHGIGYPNTLSVTGMTPYWLCNVTCTGNESQLGQCHSRGWGNIDGCSTRRRAAVVCYNQGYSTSLVNGGANYGRLEITIDGTRGSVCDQGWSGPDPEVACRELDFQSGSSPPSSVYGRGTGMVWLSSVACTGSEASILHCAHPGLGLSTSSYWTSRCSSHAYDAGAHCFGNIRLIDGPNRSFGRVEAYNSSTNQWHVFCDDGHFDNGDAEVLCRDQGFSGGRAICCSALVSEGDQSSVYMQTIVNVSCEAQSSSLDNCSYTVGQCPTRQYISLYCLDTPSPPRPAGVRISINESVIPDIPPNNGRLIVTLDGIEGRACHKNFDDNAANVACRMLGYNGGVAYQLTLRRRTPYVMHHVECNGTERSLADCNYSSYNSNSGCSYGDSEAGVLCFNTTGFQVRLSSENHGLVELALDGQWGPICTTGWSQNDAKVLCRQLGHVDGATSSELWPSAYSPRAWMSSIYCDGSESSLLRCKNSGWGNVPYYCTRTSRYAGATCYDTVRVTMSSQGAPATAGSVEVYVNDAWGLVCDEGFDNADARVVCKQLGHRDGIQSCCSAFGFRYMQTLWRNVGCGGTESSIHDCPHDMMPVNGDCSYAAVVCLDYERNDTDAVDYSLLLSREGGVSYSGKVLVEAFGVTGRICSDGWNNNAAKVVCAQLGFPYGEAYHHYDAYTNYLDDTGPWWTSNVRCPLGNETRLDECQLTPWGTVSDCVSGHSAGVLCYATSGTFFRLAGGGDNYGRVEVSVNNEWGTVCDTNWAWPEASVFCRQMGYADGETMSSTSQMFPGGSGPVWLSRFQCVGDENSLTECGHSGFNTETSSSCRYHMRDAGVYCFKSVRLETGVPNGHNDISAGAVLYVQNHTWSAVCADNFTDLTAGQVCRELGHYDGRAILGSAYRFLPFETNNGTLSCVGGEVDIVQCYRDLNTCLSGEYASVICVSHNLIHNESVYQFSLDDSGGSTQQSEQQATGTYKHGAVRVHYLGQDGRMCSNGWADAAAIVLCRSLGYDHGVAYNHSLHNLASTLGGVPSVMETDDLPFVLGQITCSGNESDLLECEYQDRLSFSECSWDIMAGAACFSNYSEIEYRLVDGPSENQGRVEMKMAGVWGTICDASWGDADARVLCRSLNYTDGEALYGAHYGEGTGVVWISHVHCNGSEGVLHQCNHQGFNTSFSEGAILTWDSNRESFISPSWPVFKYCNDHVNDASAFCFDQVRLSNGANASNGAVLISEGGQWTLVCDEGWTNVEAMMVCKQLGFVDGLAIPHSSFGLFDDLNISQKIQCSGDEEHLMDCRISSGVCNSGLYASVYCSQELQTDTEATLQIRNDSINSSYHGALLLQYKGFLGRVCINDWTDTEADVACRMLNFTGGVAYRHVYSVSGAHIPVMMSNVSCVGNESSLTDCQYTMWGDPYVCKMDPYEAGVICSNQLGIQYRIAGGTSNSGRVEVSYDGQWGTVCDLYWNMPDAYVFCRSQGYVDGQAISAEQSPESWGQGRGPIWLQAAMCIGSEISLLTCSQSGWNQSWSQYEFYSCYLHRRDAGVQCYSDYMAIENIRLVGGPDNSTGRVEVYMSQAEEWGTICDDLFDERDATVICRMLGYRRGLAISSSSQFQTAGTGPIWFDNLRCQGDETHLQNCSHQGIGNHNCHHFEDAGVQCFELVIATTTSSVPSTSPSTTSTTSTISTTTVATRTVSTTSSTSRASPPVTPSVSTSVSPSATTPTTASDTTTVTITTSTTMSSTRATTPTVTTPMHTPSTTQSTSTTTPTTTVTTGTTTPSTTTATTTKHPSSPLYTTSTAAGTATTTTLSVNSSMPVPHEVTAGMTSTLKAVIGVGAVIAIAAIILIVVFFIYRQRKRTKRRGHGGAISLSDIDNSVPYEAAGMDPGVDQQFSNRLYDLVGKNPDLYKSMDASDAGPEGHTKADISSDEVTLTKHEFLPAMEEISFSNVPHRVGRKDSNA